MVNIAKQIRPCNRNCVKNLGVADQLKMIIYLQLLGPIYTILETAKRLFYTNSQHNKPELDPTNE